MKKIMTMCLSTVVIAALAYADDAPASAPEAEGAKKSASSPAPEAARRPPRRNPGMGANRNRNMPVKCLGVFGRTAEGKVAKIYRIEGHGGLILDVTDYGGRVVRCYAPDK